MACHTVALTNHHCMTLGLLREANDPRVALTPVNLTKLAAPGLRVLVERGAGTLAHYPDSAYTEAGATLTDRATLLAESDLVVSVFPLEANAYRSGSTAVSQWQPYADPDAGPPLVAQGITAFSMDMIPRTTLAQAMDVLSSMAGIAGYQAVLLGAASLSRFMPMMVTAAGTVKPSKVLVLGAGVAGLQAIATARRLGATVEAFDTRAAAKEEVESLGARFVVVEGAADDRGAGGYAVAQSEEFLARQRAEVQARAAKADLVICTAQVRGSKAPTLITADTVAQMRPGSVVVDLAASTGGNCEVTKNNQTIDYQGVTVIGDSQLAARMPQDASTLYGNNLTNFLRLLITKEGELAYDLNNEIVKGSKIA
jgi:H+-translocating NAD(P) transhydrogenase subunit alpha